MSLLDSMKRSKPLHMTLIDPGSVTPDKGSIIGEKAAAAGTDIFLLGGSTNIDPIKLDTIARQLRTLRRPVVLFPGNINGITREADAILYLVLMNSLDPYYITGVQVQAAPLILKTGLEVIPTSYVIVGYGGTVGHIGRALPVPNEKPELIASYALAGSYMGAKAVYLEAGSGSP
ncbi:MAG: phosphoglycerol geranylgeranyltransferase, partial [Desulfurococcales archaeon]|nr:phosphoglycerol geranylgeranyltransferase [Desulfurococcales archaeon]